MTTSAPKMLRSHWLRIRYTPTTLHRERPMRQIGPGLYQALDGRKYQRTPIPGRPATKANNLFWPHRKAKAARPATLNGAICLNGRPHYSKADTKRVKRQRRQLREIEAFNKAHGLRPTA